MKVERIIAWLAGVALVAVSLFPPFMEIDASDTAQTRYRFVSHLHGIRWGAFVWLVTLFLLVLEWLTVIALAVAANWLVGWLEGRSHASSSS